MSPESGIPQDRIIAGYVNDAESFQKLVIRGRSCWLFGGYVNKGNGGYGVFSWHGRPTGAHRVAWELANGPIPPGGHILHKCDTPRCVNPAHLFLGDQNLNMKDAAAKGRLHVPRPHRRKIADHQIARMFELRSDGWVIQAIADEFNVSKSFVSFVLRGLRRVYTAPQLQGKEASHVA